MTYRGLGVCDLSVTGARPRTQARIQEEVAHYPPEAVLNKDPGLKKCAWQGAHGFRDGPGRSRQPRQRNHPPERGGSPGHEGWPPDFETALVTSTSQGTLQGID